MSGLTLLGPIGRRIGVAPTGIGTVLRLGAPRLRCINAFQRNCLPAPLAFGPRHSYSIDIDNGIRQVIGVGIDRYRGGPF